MSEPENRYARYVRPDEDGPDIGLYMQAVTDDAKAWFEAQKAVTVLEVGEKVGKLSSMLLLVLVLGLITATALVLWFIALAIWLGDVLGDTAVGFLVAGGLFLLLGAVFYFVWRGLLRDKVTLAVINAMHDAD
jgi:hypothetical protein